MKKQLLEWVLGRVLGNPIGLAITALVLVVAGVVWFYLQVQETKAGEELKLKDRQYGDSIWND